jgi:hypothetical protein
MGSATDYCPLSAFTISCEIKKIANTQPKRPAEFWNVFGYSSSFWRVRLGANLKVGGAPVDVKRRSGNCLVYEHLGKLFTMFRGKSSHEDEKFMLKAQSKTQKLLKACDVLKAHSSCLIFNSTTTTRNTLSCHESMKRSASSILCVTNKQFKNMNFQNSKKPKSKQNSWIINQVEPPLDSYECDQHFWLWSWCLHWSLKIGNQSREHDKRGSRVRLAVDKTEISSHALWCFLCEQRASLSSSDEFIMRNSH